MNLWCQFNVSSLFSMFSWNIDESSMKQWWITDDEKSYIDVFYGWIQSSKIKNVSNSFIFDQTEQNHRVERQKSNKSNFERKKLTDVFENVNVSVVSIENIIMIIKVCIGINNPSTMMHQFYLKYRKHWWIFEATLMFHQGFQCFSKWNQRWSIY